jgi:2-dehydro-3-deoxyglucarate aldolase
MNHGFRKRVLRGELLFATFITLNSPDVAELLSGLGFDWLFIDAEHATFGTLDMQRMLQGAGAETPCLIRVERGDELFIKKALDIGAAGVIVPQVNSAEHARRIVQYARYSPTGSRGVGIARAHGFGMQFQECLSRANDEITVVVQAEHIDSVENIESIVAVPGIDAVLIGPYDLSASLGKLGQLNDPQVLQAIDRVTEACLAAGVRLGIFGLSAEAVKPYIERGYSLVIAGVDTVMLGQAASQLLLDLQGIDAA